MKSLFQTEDGDDYKSDDDNDNDNGIEQNTPEPIVPKPIPTWISVGTNEKSAKLNQTSNIVQINEHSFVVAGDTSHGGDGFYEFNTTDQQWTQIQKYGQKFKSAEHALCFNEKYKYLYLYSKHGQLSTLDITNTQLHIKDRLKDVGSHPNMIVLNDYLHIICGGLNKRHYIYNVQGLFNEYDIANNEWNEAFKFDKKIWGATLIHSQTRNELFLFGGTASGWGYLDSIYKCEMTFDSKYIWQEMCVKLPYKLNDFGVVITKNDRYCVVFGGKGKYNICYNRILILDINEMTFAESSAVMPFKGTSHAVLMGNVVYLIDRNSGFLYSMQISHILDEFGYQNGDSNAKTEEIKEPKETVAVPIHDDDGGDAYDNDEKKEEMKESKEPKKGNCKLLMELSQFMNEYSLSKYITSMFEYLNEIGFADFDDLKALETSYVNDLCDKCEMKLLDKSRFQKALTKLRNNKISTVVIRAETMPMPSTNTTAKDLISNAFVIIIGISEYKPVTKLKKLSGVSTDIRSFESLFTDEYNYKVNVRKDKTEWTKKEIFSYLHKCKQTLYNDDSECIYDGIVIVLSAHGYNGGIYTSDGGQYMIRDIQNMFNDQELRNYPRFIIVDACRENVSNQNDSNQKGSAGMASPNGSLEGVFYGNSAGETVSEYKGIGGIFQHELTKILRVYKSNGLTFKEIMKKTNAALKISSKNDQMVKLGEVDVDILDYVFVVKLERSCDKGMSGNVASNVEKKEIQKLESKYKDVSDWLVCVFGNKKYLSNFVDEGIDDLTKIAAFDSSDLKDIGITKVGHRRKILKFFKK